MRNLLLILVVLTIGVALTGCGEPVGDTPAPTPNAKGTAAPPDKGAPIQAPSADQSPKGKVKQASGEAPD